MIKPFIIPLIACAILLAACNRSLPVGEYIAFVQNADNGLVQKTKIGPFNYRMEYQPLELVALRNLGNSVSDIVSDSLHALCKEYEGFQFFQLQISSDNHSDFLKTNLSHNSEYYARIGYYSMSAQEDFWLVNDYDSLPCTAYHFERSYGINPYNSIILGFQKPAKLSASSKVIFQDRALGTTWMEFRFEQDAINKIPQIQL